MYVIKRRDRYLSDWNPLITAWNSYQRKAIRFEGRSDAENLCAVLATGCRIVRLVPRADREAKP